MCPTAGQSLTPFSSIGLGIGLHLASSFRVQIIPPTSMRSAACSFWIVGVPLRGYLCLQLTRHTADVTRLVPLQSGHIPSLIQSRIFLQMDSINKENYCPVSVSAQLEQAKTKAGHNIAHLTNIHITVLNIQFLRCVPYDVLKD